MTTSQRPTLAAWLECFLTFEDTLIYKLLAFHACSNKQPEDLCFGLGKRKHVWSVLKKEGERRLRVSGMTVSQAGWSQRCCWLARASCGH